MWNLNKKLELLFVLTQKEIKLRYRFTVFGLLWLLLLPILQMLIIGSVFSWFLKVPSNNYYIFLFAGLLPWNSFTIILPAATSSIVNNRDLLTKSDFPREAIPLSAVLSNFIHFLICRRILLH